jgi:prophage regulatory protein
MTRSATLQVTIIEENEWRDVLSQGHLSEAQKKILQFVAKEAVAEYIRETSPTRAKDDHMIRAKKEHIIMECRLPDTGFIRLPDVLTVIPVGKTCWWEGVKSGRFPQPVKLSARCTAWRVEDIQALIKDICENTPE